MAGSGGRRARRETSETGRDRERGAKGETLTDTESRVKGKETGIGRE